MGTLLVDSGYKLPEKARLEWVNPTLFGGDLDICFTQTMQKSNTIGIFLEQSPTDRCDH